MEEIGHLHGDGMDGTCRAGLSTILGPEQGQIGEGYGVPGEGGRWAVTGVGRYRHRSWSLALVHLDDAWSNPVSPATSS